jgi:hypothetical protein
VIKCENPIKPEYYVAQELEVNGEERKVNTLNNPGRDETGYKLYRESTLYPLWRASILCLSGNLSHLNYTPVR